MNCNCKKDIEAKLKDLFAQKVPEATGHEVELQGFGFRLTDSGLHIAQFTTAKGTALYQLKKGGAKVKTITQNMHFSYCPFCGEKSGKVSL
jgi:hypothetical protein